jgi:ligand-binding sensor domain-containing protein
MWSPTMVQDRAGFLWIATGDGLVRFDGYRFRPQERESPDPAARNLGWIRALLAGQRWPPVDRHRMGWPGGL